MPLYEYACKDCGAHFDILRPMKDADKLALCKECTSQNTQRMLSVFVAKNSEKTVAGGTGGGCAGCSGGSCSHCGH